jgi:hypothetical protein
MECLISTILISPQRNSYTEENRWNNDLVLTRCLLLTLYALHLISNQDYLCLLIIFSSIYFKVYIFCLWPSYKSLFLELCSFPWAQAGVTKYHGLGGLSNIHVFYTILEADSSRLRGPASLCLLRTLPDWSSHDKKREKRGISFLFLLVRTLILLWWPHIHEVITSH